MFPNIRSMVGSCGKRSWLRAIRYPVVMFVTALPLFAMGASPAGENSVSPYRLQVRPSICVSYDSTQPCTMAMEVTWQGDTQANVCLRDALPTPMLFCWTDAIEGTLAVDYANTTDMIYQLVEEATQGVLAEAQVKVINRDLRSSRKRRRHVWSIL